MMIRSFLFFLFFCCAFIGKAQSQFERDFCDSTLRIDYVFSGTNDTQEIAVDELKSFAGWAGRRVNLQQVPLKALQALVQHAVSGVAEQRGGDIGAPLVRKCLSPPLSAS